MRKSFPSWLNEIIKDTEAQRDRVRSDSLLYYLGPGVNLVFQSLGALIAFLLAFLGFLLLPFKKFFRFFRKTPRRRKMFIFLMVLMVLLIFLPFLPLKRKPSSKKIIILGMDGLEPSMVRKLMKEGRLPHFQQLKEKGGFYLISPPNPPESPVVWSSFVSGVNPGKHGIFDFLTRDTQTYLPDLSLFKVQEPKYVTFGGRKIPLGKSRIISTCKGIPFWRILSEKGIPCYIYFSPLTFPPQKIKGRMLSGMGVPDLLGTQGTFTLYTEKVPTEQEIGGKVMEVKVVKGHIETFIPGPKVQPGSSPLTVPLSIDMNEKRKSITITVRNKKEELREGEWSKWWELEFKGNLFTRVWGISRFYLRSLHPFSLYLSPLNFDPKRPPFPLSYPEGLSRKLAEELGFFHTLGIPEPTWGLNEGVLDENAFMENCYEILKERERILLRELKNFKEGVFFFYFGTTDSFQHMFWRFLDPQHPLHDEKLAQKFSQAIPQLYTKMDSILGEVMKFVDPDTFLIVLSDHGFSSFRYSVNLNTWLYKEGFLSLLPGAEGNEEFLKGVDWDKTKAYSLGLSGIYINLKGREKKGVVPPEEREKIISQIMEKLTSLKNPLTGEKVVYRVYQREEIYHGPYVKEAPDIIVGWKKGYRISWESALGKITSRVFEPNKKRWSGDHIFDAELVPGILLTNWKIKSSSPRIIDIAPTILNILRVKVPSYMEGKPLVKN